MRISIISVLLGSFFSMGAFAQSASLNTPALQVTKPIYAWKTESDVNKKTGRFNHCLVKNMYDNGTVLMVAENYEGIKRLALNFPQNKMSAGSHYDLTLQVDKRDVFPVEAIAISPQILTIGIPDALPDQMRKGQAVYLRGPNDEVVYTLDGVDGAITALQDCITTQKGQATQLKTADADLPKETPSITVKKDATPAMKTKPASVTDTASAPDKAPASSGSVSTAFEKFAKKLPTLEQEKKIEVADETSQPSSTVKKPLVVAPETLAKDASAPSQETKSVSKPVLPAEPPSLPDDLHIIFEKAGMAPTVFISTPDKNKASKRPLDYAWMKNDLFIGTKEQNSVPEAGISPASTYYLRMLKERCTGPFVAEAGNVVKTPSLSWLVVEAACSPGTKDDTIAALLFANDAKHLRIYFFEAPAKQGSKAIKARDTVLKTLKNIK